MSRAMPMLLSLLLGACAAGYRVGAGPMVDTQGHIGAALTISGAFGVGGTRWHVVDDEPAEERGWAMMLVLDVGAGGQFNAPGPLVDLAVGWDAVMIRDGDMALRLGLRMRSTWIRLDGQADRQPMGVDLVAASDFGRLRSHHSGIELRVGLRSDGDFLESPVFGVFMLSFVYDRIGTRDLNELFGF